jgi:hypothetical protein
MTLVATLGIGPLGSFLKPKQVCHNNKSCLECMWQQRFSLFYIFSIYSLFLMFNYWAHSCAIALCTFIIFKCESTQQL